MTDNTNDNQIKVLHKKSNLFRCDHATGAYIIGPSSDKLYFLTFFSDFATFNSETGVLVPHEQQNNSTEPIYTLKTEQGDIDNYREDKFCITLSSKTAQNLRDLLNTQFPVQSDNKNIEE